MQLPHGERLKLPELSSEMLETKYNQGKLLSVRLFEAVQRFVWLFTGQAQTLALTLLP